MTSLPGYDNWLLRGSGAFSTEDEVLLDEPCKNCGTTEGIAYTDDYGITAVYCMDEDCNTEQPFFDRDYDGPEYDPELDPHWGTRS
jgi:hypothetical protein